MVPWNKLPRDAQKTILALLVLSGVSTTAGCRTPVICDPAPPPRSATPTEKPSPMIFDPPPTPPTAAASRTPSPMIFDPPPTPRTAAPTRTLPPIICDPAPGPPSTRAPGATGTPAAAPSFRVRSLQTTSDPTSDGAVVRGSVYDEQNHPLAAVKVSVQWDGNLIDIMTGPDGSFFFRLPNPGQVRVFAGGDQASGISLELKAHDVVNVEWMKQPARSGLVLPLAEIRTVDIVWGDGLDFSVDTAWPGARLHWTVTGGELTGEADAVTWEPPPESGRYLLQLVADWGYEGLAVDSLVLTVCADGSIVIA